MKPLDQSDIRKQNVRRILELLTQHSPRTRQALAEATGLSLMTVTNLVDQLKAQNALELQPVPRCADAKRAAGRKAEHISLCGANHAWLIVDLSGRTFRYALLGLDLSLLKEGKSVPTGHYIPRLTAFVEEIRADIAPELKTRALLGVAIVAPGPYEISTDTVHNQRLTELNSIRIKALFRTHLGNYDYYVDEDVKFAVRAFSSLIEREHCELLYYLFIGEGVGGAAVHSGNMMRGLNATAGDAGQLPCRDGATYESKLSLSAFAARFSPTVCEPPLAESLLRLAQAEPQRYRDALCQTADVVADMLFTVLWVLDPSHIIIDCRYARPFEEAFISSIENSLRARFGDAGRALPVIKPAPQGMSSVTRGAVQVLQREWIERILA